MSGDTLYWADPISNFVNWYFQHGLPGNPFVVLVVFAVGMVAAIAGLILSLRRWVRAED